MSDMQSFIRERARALLAADPSRRTHADLGAAVGLSRAAVSGWLQGRSGIALDHLPAVASFFGLPLAELCRGFTTGDPFLVEPENAAPPTPSSEVETSYRERLTHLALVLNEDQARRYWPIALANVTAFLKGEESQ